MKFINFRNILIILLLFIGALPSYGQLIGRIVNDKQHPITNATILIEGTKLGTSSDSLGNFEIEQPTSDQMTLIVSAVGFQTAKKEITASEKESVIIQLLTDNLNLNEVVVSASRYGMERKKAPVIVNVLSPKLFNATQSVAMSETLNYQPGVRVENNC